MSEYLENGHNFGWGPGVATLNPEKAKLLAKFAIGNCLDVGCGSGIYADFLQSSGHTTTGVDNEPVFIGAASKRYPLVSFVKSEATKLPFKNNEFDTVILFDIIEHLDDLKMLKEAARVGKRIIISVPHANQKILSRYSLVHAHYLDKTHLRIYNSTSLRKILKKAGLKVLYCQSSLPISLSGLFINHLGQGNSLKKLFLRIVLKPFLPEPNIYSTVFAVAKKV